MTLLDACTAHRLTPGPDRQPPSTVFRAVIIIVRLLGAAYFLTTALYCIASYSSFAYYQFLRPGLITWPARFVIIHHWLYWLWLVLTAITLEPFLRVKRDRLWVAAFLGGAIAAGLWLLSHPVLATIGNTPRSLAVAWVALVFPAALALLDHRLARVKLVPQSIDRLMLATALLTPATIVIIYASGAMYRSSLSSSLGFSWTTMAFGLASSGAIHALTFGVVLALLWASKPVASLLPWPGEGQHAVLAVGTTIAASLLVSQVIFAAVAFTGPEAIISAWALAITLMLLWSSVARWRTVGSSAETGAVDAFAAPLAIRSGWTAAIGALLVPVMAVALPRAIEQFDWDFLLQKLSVLAVWALTPAILRRLMASVDMAKLRLSPAIVVLASGVIMVVATPAVCRPSCAIASRSRSTTTRRPTRRSICWSVCRVAPAATRRRSTAC